MKGGVARWEERGKGGSRMARGKWRARENRRVREGKRKWDIGGVWKGGSLSWI